MSIRTLPAAALAASALALAPPTAADDVYLTNGQVFEGVVTRSDGETLRIRMAHGEMGLPLSWVARIETGESPLAGYLERKDALEAGGSADEWLELAHWARERGLASGARESALRAAALDPSLDGLGSILRPAGYEHDSESGRWLTESERMTRRGYVRVGADWVPAAVVAERSRAAEAERAAAARAAREERLERAIALLALAELEERAAPPPPPAPAIGVPVGAYVGYAPILVRPPRRPGPPPVHPPVRARSGFDYEALAGRQPGSIIPIAVDPGAARARSDGR